MLFRLTDTTESYGSDELKNAAAKLGSAFVDGTGFGDGYPVLWWQTDAEAKDLAVATATPIENQTVTGKAIKPALELTVDDVQLVEGSDYWVSYTNNVNVGTATAVATGLGRYGGTSKSISFDIVKGDVSKAQVSEIPVQTYTSAEIKPALKIGRAHV